MIWREKRFLLIILGLLLLGNTIFFFTYRVQYESRLRELDTRLEGARSRLQQARAARVAAEQQYASYKKIQRDVDEIYRQRWSTEAERLTSLIADVKRLAVRSQLVPKTYSFSRFEPPKALEAIGATTVGIGFTVEGTYQQVRRLINLLEVSEQFVIIDQLTLTSASGELLTMTLHLKTLFRDGPPPRVPPRQI